MKSILVLGNGEFPNPTLLYNLVRDAELIMCCDGSADKLLQYRIVPDYIIGDLDSVSKAVMKKVPPKRLIKVIRQDNTDLEKAFDFLKKKKWHNAAISVAGITGLRTDLTLYNIHLLKRFQDWNLTVYDDFFMISRIERYFELHGMPVGVVCSLLPAEGSVKVTTQGLKYELKNAMLSPGGTESVSNLSAADTVAIKTSGPLYVFIAHEFMKI
jgi:thiamine pyrophosphokinase